MKIKQFIILFIISLLLSACNIGVKPKEHLGEIYTVALDAILEQDEALSSEMKYIAIDMSNFELLDENGKKEIINYFKEKYKVDVIDATFEQLEEKGLYNPDTMALEGVLLRIKKVDFKFNKNIFFEGSKYRSGLGAVGVEVTVHFKDNKWKSKEAKMTWIS
ncbi:peptide ABC transporter substrate-binding protein [Bacillus sp. FJAT-29790]|uniref:peptide ABC transporter substrate-binding protein n=1 Tax=Bacillus sp. FJAT-29790 TaxID=1895002 RepID=UPI001C22C998|nr:peptide ABC transporter substrate-binding protein [Bacillus sp. FJAT-29790]MBU8878860.1 peptide ABC transporter substrate-binding protein [Bacillus sp. FJAT-29790]